MGLDIFQSSSHCQTYYWNGFQVHQPLCRRTGNQHLCYWGMSRTFFRLVWVYFPLKNTLLLWSDNLSLAWRRTRINTNNGRCSCLETKKVGMETDLFFKQPQDVWDLSTCCMHKSTCWHCSRGLWRQFENKKTTKSWKMYRMQNILHYWLWTGRHWTAEKIGSISLVKGIEKNRKSFRVTEIIPLNRNADKRFISVLLLTLLT